MPGILLLLLVVFVLVIAGVWLTFSLLGVLITLIVAGIIGWLADKIVPGDLPYGWLGAIVAGLVGAWLGTLLLGDLGPSVAGIALIPALLGAIIIAFLADFIAKASTGRTTAR